MDLYLGMRLTEYLRFIYSLLEGYTVHLRSVKSLYSLFTARWKAIRFILWAVSRTYSQLEVLFGRQPKKHLRRNFLYISFMLYGFIEAIIEAVYRWFYFLSTASV